MEICTHRDHYLTTEIPCLSNSYSMQSSNFLVLVLTCTNYVSICIPSVLYHLQWNLFGFLASGQSNPSIHCVNKSAYHPIRQLNAYSTKKPEPQTHVVGSSGGLQPNLKQTASRKTCLFKVKPWSYRGGTDSQVEGPFSLASPVVFFYLEVKPEKYLSPQLLVVSCDWTGILSYTHTVVPFLHKKWT